MNNSTKRLQFLQYPFIGSDTWALDKFTDYINKHSIEEIVEVIVGNKRDIRKAIQNIKDSRTSYQIKTQKVQWEMEKYLPKGRDE